MKRRNTRARILSACLLLALLAAGCRAIQLDFTPQGVGIDDAGVVADTGAADAPEAGSGDAPDDGGGAGDDDAQPDADSPDGDDFDAGDFDGDDFDAGDLGDDGGDLDADGFDALDPGDAFPDDAGSLAD